MWKKKLSLVGKVVMVVEVVGVVGVRF